MIGWRKLPSPKRLFTTHWTPSSNSIHCWDVPLHSLTTCIPSLVTFDLTEVVSAVENLSINLVSIMQRSKVLDTIGRFHSIFEFFAEFGLIASESRCDCGFVILLKERQNVANGLIWEFPVRQCWKRQSKRAGSFFENSKWILQLRLALTP